MKRSKFSLSHYKLLTADMGKIVPIGLTEVLPGDTIQHATSALVRVTPLVAPVMHPVNVRIHHWFVPHRLVWDSWENFITGGPDGLDASEVPYKQADVGQGDLSDYYGIPPGTYGAGKAYSALPHRGYVRIYNEWYRDQDLCPEIPMVTGDGSDITTPTNLQTAAWEKDYFTTARPWATKGNEVTLPLGLSAPVTAVGDGIPLFDFGTAVASKLQAQPDTSLNSTAAPSVASWGKWNDTKLQANLSTATAVSVNQLREAFALQRYAEARARYGSRYTEYLAYLGVRSADSRLQRPEYLGGGKQTLQFSEVLQTGPDTSDEGVANLKGHGIGALRSNRYRRHFTEHGFIHSFMIVQPKTMYAQALPRHFLRYTKEDYWQRELQHIGQQEIFNREVHAHHSNPAGLFGYQDRYDEYRRAESTVAAEFRSTLDYWHFARIFSGDVALNQSFVESDPTKRPFAEQTQHSLWVMANHSMQARRMVSQTGTSFIK